MPEINANIVVEPIQLSVTEASQNLGVTVDSTSLSIYTGAFSAPGGNDGELQYKNGTSLGGIANSNVDVNGNLVFTNLSNVKIQGGTNGYFLQTDGTGNLVWNAGTGNVTGNGTPGGSATQVQYNDGTANFAGAVGFTYDSANADVAMGNNLSVTNNVTATSFIGEGGNLSNIQGANVSGEVPIANAVTNSNQSNITQLGTLTSLTVSGTSTLGGIGDVQITGGNDGDAIVTDGAGNLSFVNVQPGGWDNVANIDVNQMFIGRASYFVDNVFAPGNTFTSNTEIDLANNFANVFANVTGNVSELGYNDGNFWTTSFTGNSVATTRTGVEWVNYATGLKAKKPPVKGNSQYVIFAINTDRTQVSVDNGATWANSGNLPNSGSWNDIAYGDGTFIICTSQATYTYVARSTDDGNTWSQVQVNQQQNWTTVEHGPANTFMMLGAGGANTLGKLSTDDGATWGNITVPAGVWSDLVYANSTWVAVGPNLVMSSTDDGNSWSTVSFPGGNFERITYSEPYFVITESVTDVLKYAIDPSGTWSTGNSVHTGGYIASNPSTSQVMVASQAPAQYVGLAAAETLYVLTTDGNIANTTAVPNGTYKALGGIGGDNGALWIRTA